MGALKSPRCSKGHKMVEPNLYFRPDGKRECRKCKSERGKVARREAKRLKGPKPRRKLTTRQMIIKKGSQPIPDQVSI